MIKRGRILAFFFITILIGVIIGFRTDEVTGNIPKGLDLQGGFEVLYDVKPANKGDVVDREALVSTVRALENRANVLGVSEPNIQIEGERIRVQLAGVEDQNKAREILSTEAKLTFRDVEDKEYLNGSDLVQGAAKQTFDPNSNEPVVSVKLKDQNKFKETTAEIFSKQPQGENQLIIWLDYQSGDKYKEERTKENPKYLSNPNVNEVLDTSDVIISGQFSIKEAQELANLLNAGSLPVQLDETYSTSVGAKFGEEALNTTVLAGIIGVSVIFVFMLFYYRLPGAVAVITLSAYIFLILQIFDWMNGVLTLPGIAALILGVGMAVDANIITYERIKEELKLGKSVRSAFKSGNRRSFMTILDANLTTMLAGGVLFFFGTSAVKGFATMLLVSITASFITAVFLSRILLSLLVESRWLDKKKSWFGVKKSQMLEIYETDKYTDAPTRFDKVDFLKYRNAFFAFSGITIAAGIVILLLFKLNLGIDFTSGTRVQISSDQPLTAEQVETDLKELNMEASEIVLAGNNNETAVARFAGVLDKEEIAELKTQITSRYGQEPGVSTVSPEVGKELARNALYGILIASVGIVLYVAVRFEWRMGVASIAALLYDAFFIIAIFSLTRLEVDLTFIAAILTIVGYSINDTIVTFDRIRELYKKTKVRSVDDLKTIVNKSLQQTFTRSINTVLTVVFTTVALLIFGSEAIRNFSIALLIGLISGAYSSIFIAAQLWLIMKKREFLKKKDEQTKEIHSNQHPEV